MRKNDRCKLAALAAAMALAMGSTPVMAAAPAAGQLPGQGKVVVGAGSLGAVNVDNTAHVLDIAMGADTVIDWGAGTAAADINSAGTAGFNIGAGGAVNFTGAFPVLNIDSTGNPSQIFGALVSTGDIYVANSNGIIVGATGSIEAAANGITLLGNTTINPNADFGTGALSYDGDGGDVTVQAGASLAGATILISGGGRVNVDLGAIKGATSLSAGVSQGAVPATSNASARIAITGGRLDTGSIVALHSAGTASNAATVDLSALDASGATPTLSVNGVFTNSGDLVFTTKADGIHLDNQGKLDTTGGVATFASLVNDGAYAAAGIGIASGSDLINSGSITGAGAVTLAGGNLVNAGSMDGVTTVTVSDGYIANGGSIAGTGLVSLITQSDSADDAYAARGQYYIDNTGTITSGGGLYIAANMLRRGVDPTQNDSRGSFTTTGTLQLGADGYLQGYAQNNFSLDGAVQVDAGGTYKDVSKTSLLSGFSLNAGGDGGPKPGFGTAGALTIAVPLYFDGTATSWAFGPQVKLMASVYGIDPADGSPTGKILIQATDALADDYAVRLAAGQTLSVHEIVLEGYGAGDMPNVILQGTMAANSIWLEGSDMVSGPAGGIVTTGSNPHMEIYFTGGVKTAKYLNDADNFRYNYLPISNQSADALLLDIIPIAYDTNGTSNGKSALNVLVDGNVFLKKPNLAWNGAPAPTVIDGAGTAVTGVLDVPNTHLVLQATGNIEVDGGFYWPGYVYLGTIDRNADGLPAPGTLSADHAITLDGDFSNVLPGDLAGASGIHFMSAKALDAAGMVTTNANAWINLPTDLLTQGYAQGLIGSPFFFGGTATGLVVNYAPYDKAQSAKLFNTQPVDATR